MKEYSLPNCCGWAGSLEAGCDEAGRGCLAGPVSAAAVILPPDFHHPWLNDSKQVTPLRREKLRGVIEQEAVAWAVAFCTAQEVDEMNVLRASIVAMHRALDALSVRPESVVVDGNRFVAYGELPFRTFVRGDGKFGNIAAASILAKTHRDEFMRELDSEYPQYHWAQNKGYPTSDHRKAIRQFGPSPYHRKSFCLLPPAQLVLPFPSFTS